MGRCVRGGGVRGGVYVCAGVRARECVARACVCMCLCVLLYECISELKQMPQIDSGLESCKYLWMKK